MRGRRAWPRTVAAAVLASALSARSAMAAPPVPLTHAAPATHAAPVTHAAPDREGWPATRAGEIAHRWVQAFNAGEHDMKATLATIMADGALTKKPLLSRVERYRDLKARFGSLTLVAIEKSEPGRLEVTLAAADLSSHRFVFTLEKRAPFKLEQVGMMESVHGGFGGFMH